MLVKDAVCVRRDARSTVRARPTLRAALTRERGAFRQPPHDDIARVVKETISALNPKKDVADDESTRKQREEIVRALTQCKGRVGGADGAAALMGINRTTLIARIKKLGIDPRQYS